MKEYIYHVFNKRAYGYWNQLLQQILTFGSKLSALTALNSIVHY